MPKRPISSAKFSPSDDMSSLERPLADIAESLNTSRMTLLTLQTQIERLNSQQTSLYTQFEKIDRLVSRLSELPAQVDKIDRLVSRLSERSETLDRLLPHLNELQAQCEKIDHALTTQNEKVIPQVSERLESWISTHAGRELKELSAVCVDAVETMKNVQGDALSHGLEALKDVVVRQRATEAEGLKQSMDLSAKELGAEIHAVVRQQTESLRQSADLKAKELEDEIQTIKESLAFFDLESHMHPLKETASLQQDAIAHLVSEMKARMSSLEEQIAMKADVGEIMVKLEQMQIIEKENIALLSQHVSQVPNAHQLAQIYYAINKKASGRMVSSLWVASTAAILVLLLFQPQIHQILETYWMIILSISS